jgi:hypothetical protein
MTTQGAKDKDLEKEAEEGQQVERGTRAANEEAFNVEQQAKAEQQTAESTKWRYFTVSADIQLASQDQNISPEAVEAAVSEQVIMPSAVNIQGFPHVNIVGVTAGGVSESDSPTQHSAGFGRGTTGGPVLGPEALGAPARSQERVSPAEAIVGETAVMRSGVELGGQPEQASVAQLGSQEPSDKERFEASTGVDLDEREEDEDDNLDEMTKDELLDEARSRGIRANASMSKAEIRQAIDEG